MIHLCFFSCHTLQALSFLSRSLEANPSSVASWMVYLYIFYKSEKSIGNDDMFLHAVRTFFSKLHFKYLGEKSYLLFKNQMTFLSSPIVSISGFRNTKLVFLELNYARLRTTQVNRATLELVDCLLCCKWNGQKHKYIKVHFMFALKMTWVLKAGKADPCSSRVLY